MASRDRGQTVANPADAGPVDVEFIQGGYVADHCFDNILLPPGFLTSDTALGLRRCSVST